VRVSTSRSGTSRGYRYVRIRGWYFSLQRNPTVLGALLYWRGKPFGFHRAGLGVRPSLQRIAFVTGKLLYHRFNPPRGEVLLDLPVHGHLCCEVHRGYKVFDLARGVVTKVFSPEVTPEVVRQEIERARIAGRFCFAPSLLRCQPEESWYEEEYVNGYHLDGSSWSGFLRALEEDLLPVLTAMIVGSEPRPVDLSGYCGQRMDLLRHEESRLHAEGLEPSEIAQVRGFIEEAAREVCAMGGRTVPLVFSHGDFSPKHVLITNRGHMVVDWETFGYRSVLFDLYNAFFQQIWLGREVPGISREMKRAILGLESTIATSAPSIARHLTPLSSSARLYRLLYYIERVSRILESREPSHETLDTILRWIEAFKRYEGIEPGEGSAMRGNGAEP